MLNLFLQFFGLIFNLFLVFLIINYSSLKSSFGFESNIRYIDKMSRHNDALSKIVILLIISYIILFFQFILFDFNLSLFDGLININNMNISLIIFIYFMSIFIIINMKDMILENFFVLLTNLLGITFLLISNDWILTLIAWELFNMTLYLLVSLRSKNEAGLSAALKYFLLSAFSTTFLFIGVAILYYITGSTNYEIINSSLLESFSYNQYLIILAYTLISITLLFKLSAAPFYHWAPDLYENIETQLTMWMMIIPKLAVLSFLFILSSFSIILYLPSLQYLFLFSAILSLFIGSISLNSQWFIKRFFAYSGISHIGFMLIALTHYSNQGFIFYMIIYALTTLNIFAIILFIGSPKFIRHLSGFIKFNPFLAFAFAINLFSLAGVCLLYILRITRTIFFISWLFI